MFRKTINFDKASFLEIASRLTTNGEELMIAFRGPKNDKEISVASVLLSKLEVEQIISHLQEWLNTTGTTKVE